MSAHGMSEAGGLREVLARYFDPATVLVVENDLRDLLAARIAPEADPTAGEREPSPSTLWPHGPIVGHPKHDYYVCGSCHGPLAPGPCPAKVPTQPDPPTFDSLLSDPTQQLDSEGVVIASIPAPEPTAGERGMCSRCHRPLGDAWDSNDHACPATPDAGDASECEDGAFGSQDIANTLGGIGPDDASTNSEPLIVDLLNDLVVDCDTTERGHISVAMIPHIARIIAAREAKARAEAGEQIAQAIEAALAAIPAPLNAAGPVDWDSPTWGGGTHEAAWAPDGTHDDETEEE